MHICTFVCLCISKNTKYLYALTLERHATKLSLVHNPTYSARWWRAADSDRYASVVVHSDSA